MQFYIFLETFSSTISEFLGDQNQGSPMMQQGIRSQNPGMPNQMNSLPNNPSAMNNMRMGGPGAQQVCPRFVRR